MNYLRPDIKRGNITPDEEDLIIRMHSLLGNRWSLIAKRLPGRTDNEIKNYWNSHLSKRVNNNPSTGKTKPKPGTHKAARGPRNRNNGTAAASETIKPRKKQSTEMIKVHQPKAIRVSSFSVSRANIFAHGPSGSMCGLLGAKAGSREDATNHHNVRSVLEGDNHWYGDYYSDIIEEGDRPHSPRNLEKIFEEYQQLLKAGDNVELESFADSLLI